jgi:hypothetical protein
MNSSKLTTKFGIVGTVKGTTANSSLSSPIAINRTGSYTQISTYPINQMIDKGSSTFTIAASTTLAIDLTTGQTNPLGESIASSLAFAKIRYVFIEHDAASLSTGIVAFGSGSNQFQGPLSAAATVTLVPGERFQAESATTAGWTVDGTHKTIQIVNSSGTQSATVRLCIAGSTS